MGDVKFVRSDPYEALEEGLAATIPVVEGIALVEGSARADILRRHRTAHAHRPTATALPMVTGSLGWMLCHSLTRRQQVRQGSR
jgi:hypothetical protein